MGEQYVLGVLDAIVIGAGLAGSAAAWELARRGRSAVVLEQFDADHERGSSHGRERIVRLGYTAPEYVRLGLEALEGWSELEAEAGDELLHRTGAIDYGFGDELDEIAAAYRVCGVGHEWLSAAEAVERWPGLHFEGKVLLQPDGGWVEADAALGAFRRGAAAGGVDVRLETAVLEWSASADGRGVEVVTEAETLAAEVVVVAAGAWTSRLVGDAVSLPAITVTKEQVAYLRAIDPNAAWPCFIHRSAPLHYGLPCPGGLVKLGEHATGPVVDPDRRSFEVEPVAWARLLSDVPVWLPGVDPEPVGSRTCLYASTESDDFVIDRVGPVVVVAGLGGHGFKFGPAIGRLVADLVDGLPAGSFGLGRALVTGPGRSGSR
jgi:sarcosine oxidase